MPDVIDPLTDAHFRVFGLLVHQFARFERLIEINIHQIAGVKTLGVTALIISGLGYSAKADVLLSLLQMHIIAEDPGIGVNFRILIQQFNAYSNLRNGIAHNTWIPGDRPNTVKPMSVSSRGGSAKIKGIHADEIDYTLEELIDISDRLSVIHDNLRSAMLAAGHFRSET
jgi:hypothetical protein